MVLSCCGSTSKPHSAHLCLQELSFSLVALTEGFDDYSQPISSREVHLEAWGGGGGCEKGRLRREGGGGGETCTYVTVQVRAGSGV